MSRLSNFQAIAVILVGHVNKTSFLKTISNKSQELKLVGFAQFGPNNRCKIHAEGPKEALLHFLELLNARTTNLKLSTVKISWVEPYKIYTDFKTTNNPKWRVHTPAIQRRFNAPKRLKYKLVPTHLAIIPFELLMWEKELYKPLTPWLKRAQRTFELFIDMALKTGIKNLTIFEINSSVWKLKTEQIRSLFHLTQRWIDFMQPFFNKLNIQLKVVGRRNRLPADLNSLITKVEKNTRNNTKLIFTIAVDYSGTNEITEAVNAIIQSKIPSVDETTLDSFMWTHHLPPIDLVITSGGLTSLLGLFPYKTEKSSIYTSKRLFSELTVIDFQKAIETFINDRKALCGM